MRKYYKCDSCGRILKSSQVICINLGGTYSRGHAKLYYCSDRCFKVCPYNTDGILPK